MDAGFSTGFSSCIGSHLLLVRLLGLLFNFSSEVIGAELREVLHNKIYSWISKKAYKFTEYNLIKLCFLLKVFQKMIVKSSFNFKSGGTENQISNVVHL